MGQDMGQNLTVQNAKLGEIDEKMEDTLFQMEVSCCLLSGVCCLLGEIDDKIKDTLFQMEVNFFADSHNNEDNKLKILTAPPPPRRPTI